MIGKEIKNVDLKIPNNFFLLDSKQQNIKNKNLNNKNNNIKLDKDRHNDQYQNFNFNLFKNFRSKNPVSLKIKNKSNPKEKGNTKSFEIKFLDLNNENDLKIENLDNYLPKIYNKTKHIMSKSQINFNSILPQNDNFNKKKFNNDDKNNSSTFSKQSKRVVFTKCVNKNENINYFGNFQDQQLSVAGYNLNNLINKNQIRKLSPEGNKSISNSKKNLEENLIGNPFLDEKHTSKIFFKKNYPGNLDIEISNEDSNSLYKRDNNNQINLISNNNSIQTNKHIINQYNYFPENVFNNYSRDLNVNKKENSLEKYSINNNNTNSNASPNIDKTPIKPKRIKAHYRNFSTNTKSIDLNFKGMYDKHSNAFTDRTDNCENIIPKKLTSNPQNTYGSNQSIINLDFFKDEEENGSKDIIPNYKKDLYEKTKFNIKETFMPYTVDYINDNIYKRNNSILIGNSYINQSCNASTNTNFFKKKIEDVKNLFNIGKQTKKLHLYIKQEITFR